MSSINTEIRAKIVLLIFIICFICFNMDSFVLIKVHHKRERTYLQWIKDFITKIDDTLTLTNSYLTHLWQIVKYHNEIIFFYHLIDKII